MRETAVNHFIHTVSDPPQTVQSAFTQVCTDSGSRPSTEELRYVYGAMGETFEHSRASQIIPPWMNLMGVYDITAEVSTSAFYERLFSGVPHELKQGVAVEIAGNPATEMAKKNGRFFTSAITLGLLAGATGMEIDACINPHDPRYNTNFANAIGKHFETPAEDIAVYMERVGILLPPPDVPKTGLSLFETFLENKTFVGTDGHGICPAVRMTHAMLDQWGTLLYTNNGYRERFQTSITKESCR